MEIVKNSSINGILVIKEIPYDVAKQMMIDNHYSKKWNSSFGKINIGIFKDDVLLGCASFGNLMNPESYSSITDNKDKNSVIELNRLWISDSIGYNSETILISSSIKIIKKLYPHIKYIQSFADGRLGCGTIYKASNFNYYGYDSSLFFRDVESDDVFHKVPLENTKRPQGFLIKNRLYLDGKLETFNVKTYRYIYLLYPKTHKVLLPELPYPEYEKGYELNDYKHPIGLLCRLMIMYNFIGDDEYSKKAYKAMVKLGHSKDEITTELENQKLNESVIWFINEYGSNIKNINKLYETKTKVKTLY